VVEAIAEACDDVLHLFSGMLSLQSSSCRVGSPGCCRPHSRRRCSSRPGARQTRPR
jgi:hypothetical protein